MIKHCGADHPTKEPSRSLWSRCRLKPFNVKVHWQIKNPFDVTQHSGGCLLWREVWKANVGRWHCELANLMTCWTVKKFFVSRVMPSSAHGRTQQLVEIKYFRCMCWWSGESWTELQLVLFWSQWNSITKQVHVGQPKTFAAATIIRLTNKRVSSKNHGR